MNRRDLATLVIASGVGVAASKASGQSCCDFCPGSSVQVQCVAGLDVFGAVTVETSAPCAFTRSFAVGYSTWMCRGDLDSDGNGTVDTSIGGCSTIAEGSSNNFDEQDWIFASAGASTGLDGSGNLRLTYESLVFNQACCAPDGSGDWPLGAAVSIAVASVEFAGDEPWSLTDEYSAFGGYIRTTCERGAPSNTSEWLDRRRVTAVLIGVSADGQSAASSVRATIEAPQGRDTIGTTIDPVTGDWTSTPLDWDFDPTELTNFVFSVVFVRFDEDHFDANSDGRFNDTDASTLAGLVSAGPSSADDARWDLTGDGALTSEDVALLQSLLDAGLGSGKFGDLNDDGVLDCSDVVGAGSRIGSYLGAVGYADTMDEDLDGFIDPVEGENFWFATCQVDWNRDEVVNSGDFFDFTADFTAGNADYNRDGVTDSGDYFDFIADYQ